MNSTTELKAIIKKIDTPLTDELIEELESVLTDIRQRYENTASVIILIKMMQALGKYLYAKQEKAHSDSMPLLNSIAENLEKIIDTPYLEDNEVNKIVSAQTHEYKSFQSTITSNPQISSDDIDSLKAVILEIDWEISDTTLESFNSVVTQMISKLKKYKIHYSFLRIMHATGKYIGVQKANAPANSITFLRTVFDNFIEIVNSKDMTFKEKRVLLEQDMKRFQDFKQDISKQKKKIKPNQAPNGQTQEDDEYEVMPALSHVKSTDDSSEGEFAPLMEMSDQETFSKDIEDDDISSSKSSDIDSGPGGQQDVMDDLFNVKDSPADELLDAIHLMEVHGEKGEDHAMKMLDQADEDQAGLKNFTPERKDTTPIPEIDSRLDEFFSLDEPDQSELETVQETEVSDDISSQSPDDAKIQSDSIVPFGPEDESFEEIIPDEDAEKILSPDLLLLNKLKETFFKKAYLEDEKVLDSIQQDLQGLRNMWAGDAQKLTLLDIISSSANLPIEPLTTEESSSGTKTEGFEDSGQDLLDVESKGVLGKIKSMFTR